MKLTVLRFKINLAMESRHYGVDISFQDLFLALM